MRASTSPAEYGRAATVARRLGLVGALALVSCGSENDQGELAGALQVPGCIESSDAECRRAPTQECAPFDLGFGFFAVEVLGERVVVRMQSDGLDVAHIDGLHLAFDDLATLRSGLGKAIGLGDGGPGRASLLLFDRCPEANSAMEVTGEVVFTHFGVEKGDRVAGRLTSLVITDARGGEALGALTGTFDFTVRRGPPYQRFAGR
jgi:hypothetical protein